MKKHRAVIIGCGSIGGGFENGPDGTPFSHAGAYLADRHFSLVAACDTDRQKLHSFGKKWGVGRLYADLHEMMGNERPDVVSICTSTSMHYEHVLACLRHRPKAIICEKPICDNSLKGEEMVKACEKAGTVLFVNYFRRYMLSMLGLKAKIGSGEYGALVEAQVRYTKGLAHTGSHAIDLLSFLFGKPKVGNVSGNEGEAFGKDPTPSFELFFGKAQAAFSAGDYRRYEIFELDLFLEKGRVRIAGFGERLEYFRVKRNGRFVVLANNGEENGWGGYFLRLMENVDRTITKGERPACSGHDALCDLKVCEEILAKRKKT